ncbi:hypothetical protein F0562_006855 [Nyssa sinensis]|uniref:Uncharacterized protein n=1 Tax=Nyssa sinensis TaxID=561372 RepID=A0A5J5ALZ4_9ASTE|nr:hypothetical protein F0562_006855 [Nyssa sinensis]
MSRCFPYPPPGYEKIGTAHETLVKSIKRAEKAKKERKEKRGERKEEEKRRENGEIEKKRHGHKKRHKDERSQEDQQGQKHGKRRKNETDQFEKSSLTEEHGRPVGSHNHCDSSDSTLNSNRWQKHSSPSDDRHSPGSIIRIRLPVQRHKDPELLPSKVQSCFALGSSDALLQEKKEHAPRPVGEGIEHHHYNSRIISQDIASKLSKEKPCPSSGSSEFLSQKLQTAATSCLHHGSSLLELKFRDLIENWVPPILESECTDLDDQEWLFPTKHNHSFGVKRFEAGMDVLTRKCSASWPGACYLPEVDVYALPFTVPF